MTEEEEEFFICHIHNYTLIIHSITSSEICALHLTHPSAHTPGAVGSSGCSWGFGALLKGLTSVVDNSCRSRDSNPQPWVTSPTLYSLGHDCPYSGSGTIVPQCIKQGSKRNDDSVSVEERLGYVCNPRSLKEGTETSRRMTDELGSRQRDLSTSSVTKRANGHWHAIIASSCR